MNVLILDSTGLMIGAAMRMENPVRVHVMDRKNGWPNAGKGILTFVDDYRPSLSWADLILMADVGYGKLADQLRKKGHLVVGGSEVTDLWETDRKHGQKILSAVGIEVLPSKEFSSVGKALPFVKTEAERGVAYVSKPNDDKNDKSLSFVPSEPHDLIGMMKRWEKLNTIKSPFLLQKKVQGVEMAVGGWWTPSGWADDACCENFEFKKFLAGDLGPNTGEAGTVLRYVPVERSPLGMKILRPLEKALSKTDYTGYVDVNCIVEDGKRVWPLEFTMRCGYPTLYIQGALHKRNYGEFFDSLFSFRSGLFDMENCAVGTVLAIPDYPYSKATAKEVEGYPIRVDPDKDVFWVSCDVQITKEEGYSTAGDYIGVATAKGDHIGENRRAVNRFLKGNIRMAPAKIFRNDIGIRLSKQIPELGIYGRGWKRFIGEG